jgi:hypothetical protein
MKRLEPPVGEEAVPFWDATREGRLVLPWCTACERPIWFPRAVCPGCLGSTLAWRDASGEGAVYACTVEHKGEPPYVVALVDLDEGVRVLSNVVGCPPDAVAVGDRVRVTWEPLSDGRRLPLFEPMN